MRVPAAICQAHNPPLLPETVAGLARRMGKNLPLLDFIDWK